MSAAKEKLDEALLHRLAPGGSLAEEYLEDDRPFRDLVHIQVKGRVPERVGSYLRRCAVARRWLSALEGMERAVERQLARSAADEAAGCFRGRSAEYERWRSSALCFRDYVRERISEAEKAVSDGEQDVRGDGGGLPAVSSWVEDVLHRVRGFLASEGSMPETERGKRRERLIGELTEFLSPTAQRRAS